MTRKALIVIFALILSTASVLAADPEIEALYAVPNNPYIGTYFDIYVRAEDADGIDRIKFYTDGSLEETKDCDEEEECATYFDVYETIYGYHTYKVKVYDTEGDTETDEIRVYVRPYYYPRYCGDGRCTAGENAYNCPQDCRIITCSGEGQMIGTYPGGGICCAGLTPISTVSPDSRGVCPSTPVVGSSICTRCGNGICGIGENYCNCPQDCPRNYCGDGICNAGESCATCPQDCGTCVRCGDGRCSPSESCSSCPQDCGTCQTPIPDVIYTCEQRGGECCEYGGQGVVSGAADCPSTCFSECNPAPEPEPTPGGESAPTGAVVMSGTSLMLLGGMVVLLILVIFIAFRVR